MTVSREDGTLVVTRPTEQKTHKQLHGLTRTLVNNMVVGVTDGYRKGLEITGVGYRAALNGQKLRSTSATATRSRSTRPRASPSRSRTRPAWRSSASTRSSSARSPPRSAPTRKPEPYKGKGVRYAGEYIRRKAGKAGKIGGKK